MKVFNLVIFNNITLYNILDELKNFLNLNLHIHLEKKEDLIKFLDQNPNTIVLSSKKLEFKVDNFLIIKQNKIKQLFEKINIIISKSNFKTQSNIIINEYSKRETTEGEATI